MFDRVQLMGGSMKCFSIEGEPVVCLRRGRDGQAGPPGAIRWCVGPQAFTVDLVANFLCVWQAGEREEQKFLRTRRRGGAGGTKRKEIEHVPPGSPRAKTTLCTGARASLQRRPGIGYSRIKTPAAGLFPESIRAVGLCAGSLSCPESKGYDGTFLVHPLPDLPVSLII